jgi:hypothetical protein
MTAPKQLGFSPEWWRRVSALLGRRTVPPAGEVLTVGYAITPDEADTHQQVFVDGRLFSWLSGEARDPDLRVVRTAQIDAADLLGRMSPQEAARHSLICTYAITDLYGLPTGGREHILSALPSSQLEVTASISTLNSPFGDTRMTLRVRSGLVTIDVGRTNEASDVVISTSYASCMEWLHGRAILGNLFVEGSTVEGDLLALSFVEGVVSAPSRTPSPPYDLLVRYAAARTMRRRSLYWMRSSRSRATSDVLGNALVVVRIEAITAHANGRTWPCEWSRLIQEMP